MNGVAFGPNSRLVQIGLVGDDRLGYAASRAFTEANGARPTRHLIPDQMRLLLPRLRVIHSVVPSSARLATIHIVAHIHAGNKNSRDIVVASDARSLMNSTRMSYTELSAT
jgi:hypothetical protein